MAYKLEARVQCPLLHSYQLTSTTYFFNTDANVRFPGDENIYIHISQTHQAYLFSPTPQIILNDKQHRHRTSHHPRLVYNRLTN